MVTFLRSLEGERLWAFVIVFLGVLVFAWHVLKVGSAGASSLLSSVLYFVKSIAREITDKNAPSHERINGALIILLFASLVIVLFVLAIPSARDTVVGTTGPRRDLLITALVLVLAIAVVGVICVKACVRHNRDMTLAKSAKRLSS